jgi:hypothetical protein
LLPLEPPELEDDGTEWESDGGLWRGCANHTSWTFVTDPDNPGTSGIPPADVTIDFNLEWGWTQLQRSGAMFAGGLAGDNVGGTLRKGL